MDQAQHDQFVGQQLQRPVATSPGRVAARQLDQLLLHVPRDLDLVGPGWLALPVKRRLETLGDELVTDARNGSEAGAQDPQDVFVKAVLPVGVGQQEAAGMRQLACRCLPGGNQMLQSDLFLRCQSDPILVHCRTPVSWGMALPSSHETGTRFTCQMKVDALLVRAGAGDKLVRTTLPALSPRLVPVSRAGGDPGTQAFL